MENVTLLYATGNKSKLHNMYYRLQGYPIKVLCPDDLGIFLDVAETGTTAVENALLKANAYFQTTNLPTIAADSGVYIQGLREEEQPGLYVRRVNGKVLTDDEMIDHYSQLAEKAEGDCYLQYLTGIAIVTGEKTITMELDDAPLKLSAIPNTNRAHRGNPLDVVTVTENGRYFNELSDEERTLRDRVGEEKFTQFIVRNLLK